MLSINHGTEDTEDLGFEQAYNNVLSFIDDCEIQLYIKNANCIPGEDGRYLFTLKSPLLHKLEYEIEMPSLPLNQVRYMEEKEQNIWDYPRLYLNGSSWVWKYALITKESIIDQLEDEIGEYELSIERNRELIATLKSK